MEQSPWNDPDPAFKQIPKENPKTKKPIVLFLCSACGSVIANRRLHSKWHELHSWNKPF